MKSLGLIGFLLFYLLSLSAFSSYMDTSDITLDTVDPSLTLISPAGGEEWYIGDTHDILWDASDTNLTPTPVSVYYSLNSGIDFIPLAEMISNIGSWPWLILESQSDTAQLSILATDSFGNSTIETSPFFRITYVPPAPPDSVTVIIVENAHAFISWLPVTETIYHTPITPDGYIVLYNETTNEDEQFYYYLWDTEGLSFTHHNVALHRDQMFYKIVAYKNYDRTMTLTLDKVRRSKEPIPWFRLLKNTKYKIPTITTDNEKQTHSTIRQTPESRSLERGE